jgi:WD40-like Beta Propeller Repeat
MSVGRRPATFLELKWIAEGGSQIAISSPVVRPLRSRERLIWAIAVLAAVSLLGLVAYERFTRLTPAVVVSDIAPPKGTQFTFFINGAPAISPDGRALVFPARDATGRSSLWVRWLDGSPAQLAKNLFCLRIDRTGKRGLRTGPATGVLSCSHGEIWPTTLRPTSGCFL